MVNVMEIRILEKNTYIGIYTILYNVCDLYSYFVFQFSILNSTECVYTAHNIL